MTRTVYSVGEALDLKAECRACGRTHCAHPDPIFAGIVPPSVPSPANPAAGKLGRAASPRCAPTSLTGAPAC